MKLIFILLLLLIIPLDVHAIRQTAGQFFADLEPGESAIFKWELQSDEDEPLTVFLYATNQGKELLSFENEIILEPGVLTIIDVTATIPEDYETDIFLQPWMHAQNRGETGNAITINVEMLKFVSLTIGNPVDNISPEQKEDNERIIRELAAKVAKAEAKAQAALEKANAPPPEKSTFSIGKSESEPTPEPTPEPIPEPIPEPVSHCGAGTELVNGFCKVIQKYDPEPTSSGGSCLIATAAYGTELAPQVQFLREIRDNTVLSTASGTTFMSGFNTLYYSFAPTVADWERENPMFKEAVRVFITPMVSTLSIMTLADSGSEAEVLGLGLSVIMLNLGMYIAAPALIGVKSYNHFKSRK